MKATEELYIDRLEKMVKKYKKDPCNHCPAGPRFQINAGNVFHTPSTSYSQKIICNICRDLHTKYVNKINSNMTCPCYRYNDNDETDMIAIAWKVIHGWKKDNKEE